MSDGVNWDGTRYVVPQGAQFFALTRQCFVFLEGQFGYRYAADRTESISELDGANLRVTYVSRSMQVDVVWYLYASAIDVLFGELVNPGEPYYKQTPYAGVPRQQELPRVIDLYSLAEVLGHADDADFILGDTTQTETAAFNVRRKMLETRLADVIRGLAAATQRYAVNVLQGDTAQFPAVMQHYTDKMRRNRQVNF